MAAPRGRRRGRVVTRDTLLTELAGRVSALDRPEVVAVDGGDGAGKTTLADELAALVPGAVRASIDDFHHPRAADGVLVVDGVFAQRPELVDAWDLVVYVHADNTDPDAPVIR